MRISYASLPDHPVAEIVETIALADELGFHGAYMADETYHKDGWLIAAVAATRTKNIRLSPCVTHVILKEPTILAHTIATLDELSGGRAEAVYSIGNIAMLDQYHVDWKSGGQIERLREAHEVMRTLLDTGKIDDFEGRFYRYTGLFTSARPVQERVPLKIGAMRGPKSFELAGEISDGMHQALAYSREAMQYAADHVRVGAERAGRNWRSSTSAPGWSRRSPRTARPREKPPACASPSTSRPCRASRSSATTSIPTASSRSSTRSGGATWRAPSRLTTLELTEKLSLSGTPEEWVERIRRDVIPTGFNHLICSPIDPFLVEAWSGLEVANVPDQQGQLRLIHDRVMPELAGVDEDQLRHDSRTTRSPTRST